MQPVTRRIDNVVENFVNLADGDTIQTNMDMPTPKGTIQRTEESPKRKEIIAKNPEKKGNREDESAAKKEAQEKKEEKKDLYDGWMVDKG